MKTMLKFPLLDATIPEEKLADWIDAHTMRVHGFLDRLQQVITHHLLIVRRTKARHARPS